MQWRPSTLRALRSASNSSRARHNLFVPELGRSANLHAAGLCVLVDTCVAGQPIKGRLDRPKLAGISSSRAELDQFDATRGHTARLQSAAAAASAFQAWRCHRTRRSNAAYPGPASLLPPLDAPISCPQLSLGDAVQQSDGRVCHRRGSLVRLTRLCRKLRRLPCGRATTKERRSLVGRIPTRGLASALNRYAVPTGRSASSTGILAQPRTSSFCCTLRDPDVVGFADYRS